jgi:hypothetical protein
MFAWLRDFLHRHPLARQALVWAVPALIFGAILRGLMLSYLPYAYWGSDSRSYFGFTEQLLDTGDFSLYDKRRYLYPILLLPVTLLPGSPLKWIAWLQHALGLLTLLPLAYCVRKLFAAWRAYILPVTLLYAGLPILLWYEHELLAEALFFHAMVWMVAGWMAFAPSRGTAVLRNFWWFFGGLAAVILTKPAGRFLWPAVLFGLVCLVAWKTLHRRHWIALASLFGLTFTIGQDTQASWLLYASAFPLTRLETPLHAEYKAQIADLVRPARERLETHVRGPDSKVWMDFLKFPERQTERPLWTELGKDDAKKQRIYQDLALEALKRHPLLFLRIAFGKIIASANPEEFRSERFLTRYTTEKYAHQYRQDSDKKPGRIRRLFALPKDGDLPAYSEIEKRLAPNPHSPVAASMHRYVDRYQAAARLVASEDDDDPTVDLTPLAWWILIGGALALLPRFFRPLGIPVLLAWSYLFGTFLVGGINARYFGAVWAIVLLALCVPLDLGARALGNIGRKGRLS